MLSRGRKHTTVSTTNSGLSVQPRYDSGKEQDDEKAKKKTRSDKFPLTLHPTGQYCKKINGKIYYFGTNKKQALQRYLDQATYLHGYPYVTTKGSDGSMALKLSLIHI